VDIPQIAGRIRTKSNPFRNKIIHIFNPKKVSYYIPLEIKKQELEKELATAHKRVLRYNSEPVEKDEREQEDAERNRLGPDTYIIKRVCTRHTTCQIGR